MIIKKEKKGNITIYHVDKDVADEKMELEIANKFIKPSQIKTIIDHNADVYTVDGRLLLKFRKGVLSNTNTDAFYENIIDFAKHSTGNRGSTTGSKSKNIRDNPRVMSNIFGYFDKFSPIQKYIFKKSHKKIPAVVVRECRFNQDYPEKYKRVQPLIRDIDALYEKLTPEHYAAQNAKAKQTHFKIPGTTFTTVTTNVNFQTTVHRDKGDDREGFGNLAVIEHGKYQGGETCFPQYGIGVDVRTGDMLFMDVHQWHANLPIKLQSPDAIRLSIVCYLRYKVWEQTKGKSKEFMIKHNKTLRNMRRLKKE